MRKFLQIIGILALVAGLYAIYYSGTDSNWLAAIGWWIATVEGIILLTIKVMEKKD